MRDTVFFRERVQSGDPWYVSDHFKSHLEGVYRHSIAHRLAYVRRALEQLDLDGARVLDLGCGDGQWSHLLARYFDCQLVGVDMNSVRIQRYRENAPSSAALLGSCYDLPLCAGAVDLVLFNQVLEHLEKPSVALQEIRRVLRPEGTLLISVPNEGTWLKQRVQYRYIQPVSLQTTDHIQFFTSQTLRSTLEGAGFNVQRLDAVGFYLPHNGIHRRVVTHRRWYELGLGVARFVPVLHDCLFAVCNQGDDVS